MVASPAAGERLGQVADRDGPQGSEELRRDDLGAEDDDDIRVELLQAGDQRRGRRGRAEVDELRSE